MNDTRQNIEALGQIMKLQTDLEHLIVDKYSALNPNALKGIQGQKEYSKQMAELHLHILAHLELMRRCFPYNGEDDTDGGNENFEECRPIPDFWA